jgi:predicted neuraminidase
MNPQITGAAGEYFVAAELSLRGWIATLTLKNTPGIDILAVRNRRSITLQVKTRSPNNKTGWRLSRRDEIPNADWVVLVDLTPETPDYWIIPGRRLAGWVIRNHQEWLATLDRHGQKHKDSAIRQIKWSALEAEFKRYHANWNFAP